MSKKTTARYIGNGTSTTFDFSRETLHKLINDIYIFLKENRDWDEDAPAHTIQGEAFELLRSAITWLSYTEQIREVYKKRHIEPKTTS